MCDSAPHTTAAPCFTHTPSAASQATKLEEGRRRHYRKLKAQQSAAMMNALAAVLALQQGGGSTSAPASSSAVAERQTVRRRSRLVAKQYAASAASSSQKQRRRHVEPERSTHEQWQEAQQEHQRKEERQRNAERAATEVESWVASAPDDVVGTPRSLPSTTPRAGVALQSIDVQVQRVEVPMSLAKPTLSSLAVLPEEATLGTTLSDDDDDDTDKDDGDEALRQLREDAVEGGAWDAKSDGGRSRVTLTRGSSEFGNSSADGTPKAAAMRRHATGAASVAIMEAAQVPLPLAVAGAPPEEEGTQSKPSSPPSLPQPRRGGRKRRRKRGKGTSKRSSGAVDVIQLDSHKLLDSRSGVAHRQEDIKVSVSRALSMGVLLPPGGVTSTSAGGSPAKATSPLARGGGVTASSRNRGAGLPGVSPVLVGKQQGGSRLQRADSEASITTTPNGGRGRQKHHRRRALRSDVALPTLDLTPS